MLSNRVKLLPFIMQPAAPCFTEMCQCFIISCVQCTVILPLYNVSKFFLLAFIIIIIGFPCHLLFPISLKLYPGILSPYNNFSTLCMQCKAYYYYFVICLFDPHLASVIIIIGGPYFITCLAEFNIKMFDTMSSHN